MTLANAATRRISEIRVAYRITVVDLVENAIVGNEVFDGRTRQIVRVKVAVKFTELQRVRRWAVEKATDKPNAAPARLRKKALIHKRRRGAADEDALCVSMNRIDGKVDRLRNFLVLERKQRGDVNAVPGLAD